MTIDFLLGLVAGVAISVGILSVLAIIWAVRR